MSKIFKDEKIFNKFKTKYKFIFKDQNLKQILKNHFNKNGSLIAFTFAFLENRLSEEKVIKSAKKNSEEWVELFSWLYINENIISSFEQLKNIPCMNINEIKKSFNVFDGFIDKLWKFVNDINWNINMDKEEFSILLSCSYGYLMYNSVECKLKNNIDDIVQDENYDQKYEIILNNTKLFAEAKLHILENCGLKINDLITILLGGSNHLALDK